ncbi:MAG: hypothetical protein AB1757_17850 [Acidobacteriota bacterium]
MDYTPRKDYWVQTAIQRLQADRFTFLPDNTFKMVAHRSGFELSKFGNAETFFIFHEFDYTDANLIRRFSADAFNHAMKLKTNPLPCGFFESVWCFAVAISHNVDDMTAQILKTEDPPKHWSAGEMRVCYDAPRHGLYYFEKTPVWGAAYYAGFRNQIKKYLG